MEPLKCEVSVDFLEVYRQLWCANMVRIEEPVHQGAKEIYCLKFTAEYKCNFTIKL